MIKNALKIAKACLYSRTRGIIGAALRAYEATPEALCPCCGRTSKFSPFGLANRPGAACVPCGSLERHRLLKLALDRGLVTFRGKRVLHFAAEASIAAFVRSDRPAAYVSADIEQGRCDKVVDIERMDIEDGAFDVIICSHVLEHVDDYKALGEFFRVLSPGGIAIIMIPIIEGWSSSYENPSISSPSMRELHFGQNDHVRYYGADVRERIVQAGFELTEFTADGVDSVKYGLLRGETVFIAHKISAQR